MISGTTCKQALYIVKQELECIERQNGTVCDNARDCSTCDLRADEDILVNSYRFIIQLLEHIIELDCTGGATYKDGDYTAERIINEFEAKILELPQLNSNGVMFNALTLMKSQRDDLISLKSQLAAENAYCQHTCKPQHKSPSVADIKRETINTITELLSSRKLITSEIMEVLALSFK